MSKETLLLQGIKKAIADNNALLCCIQDNTSQTSLEIAAQNMVPSYVTGLTTSGSVTAGARSVTFFNSGTTNVTVAGGTLIPGRSITFSAGGESDVLTAIPYDATGGTLEYVEVRPQ